MAHDLEKEDAGPPASSPPSRAVATLTRACGAVSALLIVAVLAVVGYAIFQRYVLDTPLLWGDELIGYLLVAIVMFGTAEALRRGDHIAIDFLSARAGPRLSVALAHLADLAVIGFAAVVGISTWGSVRFAYGFGSYSSGYIEIATWIPQLPILLGMTLIAFVSVTRLIERVAAGLRP